MSSPSEKEISKKLKLLLKAEPTYIIDRKTASASDILKSDLCQQFVAYMHKKKISQAELARELETDRAIVNKIILHRIGHFTADRLIDLLSKIKPVSIKLA